MSELERLYEVLGQHRERVDVMRRRLDVASDPASRRSVRFRMAVILERELQDVDEAISTVLAILDESAEDADGAGDAGLAVRAQGRGQRAAGGAGPAAAAWRPRPRPARTSCAAWPGCWRARWPGQPRRSSAGARCWSWRRPTRWLSSGSRPCCPDRRVAAGAGGGPGAGAAVREERRVDQAGRPDRSLHRRRRGQPRADEPPGAPGQAAGGPPGRQAGGAGLVRGGGAGRAWRSRSCPNCWTPTSG